MTVIPEGRGYLDVYLGEILLGEIEDRGLGFVVFDFAEEAIDHFGAGSRVLSVGIPTSYEQVDAWTASYFFGGLLPEGRALDSVAAQFQVDTRDTFGILRLIGRESAGALTIVPQGEGPPEPDRHPPPPLSDAEIAAMVAEIGQAPLGITIEQDEVRLSLAGVQDKLLLVRLPNGELAQPGRGQPSTVIVKWNSNDDWPDLVANEAFCLTVSTVLGVQSADCGVRVVDGQRLLVVDRYDRVLEPNGNVRRLHQEDICQAAVTNPQYKYETRGGPSLRTVAELLDRHSFRPGIDRTELFRLVTVNALLGNCDAHAKNLSLLHAPEGVTLAPAYDIVSTAIYPQHSRVLGMRIGGVERLLDVDSDALLAMADDIGISHRLARSQLDELRLAVFDALDAASERAHEEGWYCDRLDRLDQEVRERAEQIFA